jgi:hypothetical protein
MSAAGKMTRDPTQRAMITYEEGTFLGLAALRSFGISAAV